MEDRVALNLLYAQAVAEVERGWVLADMDTRDMLSSLQSRGEKEEVREATTAADVKCCCYKIYSNIDR